MSLTDLFESIDENAELNLPFPTEEDDSKILPFDEDEHPWLERERETLIAGVRLPPPEDPEFEDWQKHFPMPTFRAYQSEIIPRILDAWKSGKRYVIVEGTTGSGKSVYALTMANMFGDAFLATPQKMLQNQYMKDFPNRLFELKGRANYPCLRTNYNLWFNLLPNNEEEEGDDQRTVKYSKIPRVPVQGQDYMSLQDYNILSEVHPQRGVNCANSKCNSLKEGPAIKNECRQHGICEYIKRRNYALKRAPVTLMNFSNLILFTMLMPKVYPKRPLLILDECHTLEQYLYSFATITLDVRKLKCLVPFLEDGLDDFCLPMLMHEFVDYIHTKLLPACRAYETSEKIKDDQMALRKKENAKNATPYSAEERLTRTPRKIIADINPDYLDNTLNEEDKVTFAKNDERARINSLEDKLEELLREEPTDHSHVLIPIDENTSKDLDSTKKERFGYQIQPFSVAKLGPRLAFGSSNSRVLLMSATILDPVTFCKSVGITPGEAAFIRVPSTFPAKNRLIYSDLTVGSMTYWCKRETMPRMIDKILELSEKHIDHKGIIHTGNYDNMVQLHKWSKRNNPAFYARLLCPTDRTYEHKAKIIKRHFTTKEPTILCGPGFAEGLDLKDDLARFNMIMKLPFLDIKNPLVARKKKEFPEWYRLQTALAVIQAIGRSVRSEADWSLIYILDLAFEKFYTENELTLFPPYIREAIRWIQANF